MTEATKNKRDERFGKVHIQVKGRRQAVVCEDVGQSTYQRFANTCLSPAAGETFVAWDGRGKGEWLYSAVESHRFSPYDKPRG